MIFVDELYIEPYLGDLVIDFYANNVGKKIYLEFLTLEQYVNGDSGTIMDISEGAIAETENVREMMDEYHATNRFHGTLTSYSDLAGWIDTLPAKELRGMFILRIKFHETNKCDCLTPDCEEEMNVPFANFLFNYECLLNGIKRIEKIENCKVVVRNCDSCADDINIINTLMQGVERAFEFGYYNEALRIQEKLDKICQPCYDCFKDDGDYGKVHIVNGVGYGTFGNHVRRV